MQQRQNQPTRNRSNASNPAVPNSGNAYPPSQPGTNYPPQNGNQFNQYPQNPPGSQAQRNQFGQASSSTAPYPISPQQHPFKSMLNPSTRARTDSPMNSINTNDSSRSTGSSLDPAKRMQADPVQTRKVIADMVIRDVYSKMINVNGARVPETTYQTHVLIKEYSQYPSKPPPQNSEISGSIKNRILVICTKHSGRAMIQKGKFNDSKNVYQIGRTWDMDELKSISRIGPEEIIVKLNKDYYWRISEGSDRTTRFIRGLAMSYGRFMGRYPILNGIGPEELKLTPLTRTDSMPSRSNSHVNNHPPSQVVSSSQNVNSGNRNVSQPSAPQDYYKDFDFTSNGQLPMKPMKVIERGSSSNVDLLMQSDHQDLVSNAEDSFNFVGTHEQNDITESKYSARDTVNSNSARDLQQSYETDEFRTPLGLGRNSKIGVIPEEVHGSSTVSPRKQFINNENVYNRAQEDTNHGNVNPNQYDDFKNVQTPLSQAQPFAQNATDSPDFGIVEVTDESEVDEGHGKHSSHYTNDAHSTKARGTSVPSNSFSNQGDEFDKLESAINTDPLDTSIQEIENLLDSQFTARKEDIPNEVVPKPVESHETELSRSMTKPRDAGNQIRTEETGSNLRRENDETETEFVQSQVDPEIDEILDEINWKLTDSGNELINKLTEELEDVKGKNVKELIALDFSNSNLANEFGTSIGEVDNLSHIFKKMELEFKLLTTDVGSVETNSKGLQVKFLNKQNLQSTLQGLLEKVSINSKDLSIIANFQEFGNWESIPQLEIILAGLYGALATIRSNENTSTEGLSSMLALRQYLSNYGKVTNQFIYNFSNFIDAQMNALFVKQMNALETFNAKTMMNELNNYLVYSGITFFIKYVDPSSFREIIQRLNSKLSNLFEKLLTAKLKRVQTTSNGPLLNTLLSQSLEGGTSLKKSRTLRLSRSKTKKVDEKSDTEVETLKRRENQIEDPMVVNSLVQEAKELIAAIRYFVGVFFHYDTSAVDFEEYIAENSLDSRIMVIEKLSSLDAQELKPGKSYATSESINTMTAVFGNFINMFIKNVNPVDYRIPQILVYVEDQCNRAQGERSNQDFLIFNFFKRVIDKFRNNWNKFIGNNIDAINKSVIVANCGILPAVKNTSELIMMTERSKSNKYGIGAEVSQMIDKSYAEITEALSHLFMREDPLLKNHEFDDKERIHRNISALQNIFYLLDLLSAVNSPSVSDMCTKLSIVFNTTRDTYFHKQLHKIGKITEFIQSYESLEKMGTGKTNKSNKKHLKTILAGYTTKDVTQKVQEIHRKLEKHFVTGESMFERDLVNKLWLDMESEFATQFQKLNVIIRKEFGNDMEYSLSKQEIHSIFRSVQQ